MRCHVFDKVLKCVISHSLTLCLASPASLRLLSALVLTCPPTSLSLCFSQHGSVGPVSHSGGPGARCPSYHCERDLRPPCRRCYPEAGGKDT